MVSDRAAGALIILVSVAIVLLYIYLVFFPPPVAIAGDPIDLFTLKVMGLVALLVIFGLLSWIGYTLLTSPRPRIEELEEEDERDTA